MALRGMKQGNRQLGPLERVVLTIPVREIGASPQGREGENGRDCVRVRERGENIGGRIEAGDPRSQSPELGGLLSPQDKTHIRTCPSYVTRAPPDPPRHSAIKPRLRLLPSTSSSLLQCSRTDAASRMPVPTLCLGNPNTVSQRWSLSPPRLGQVFPVVPLYCCCTVCSTTR